MLAPRGFREVKRLPPCPVGGSATYLSQPPVAHWYFTDGALVYTSPGATTRIGAHGVSDGTRLPLHGHVRYGSKADLTATGAIVHLVQSSAR